MTHQVISLQHNPARQLSDACVVAGACAQSVQRSARLPLRQLWQDWLQRLAYRHKLAETVIYLLFLSGILLWSPLQVSWPVQRWAIAGHMLIGVVLFWFTVGVFWWAHRKLLLSSRKPWLRMSGRGLEILIGTCALTGVILFWHGNPGDLLGRVAHVLHLYSSFILTLLLLCHAWRWSVVRLRRAQR